MINSNLDDSTWWHYKHSKLFSAIPGTAKMDFISCDILNAFGSLQHGLNRIAFQDALFPGFSRRHLCFSHRNLDTLAHVPVGFQLDSIQSSEEKKLKKLH